MENYKGSCHCGKVQFEAQGDVKAGVSCNCSICHRKGTLLAFIPESNFKLISGADSLTDYQFGKKKLHHTFCSTCGVTAFASGAAPDGTKMKAINIRCLDGVDLKSLTIHEYDGKAI